MAIHFSILAWKISWAEEPGRLESVQSHIARICYLVLVYFIDQLYIKTVSFNYYMLRYILLSGNGEFMPTEFFSWRLNGLWPFFINNSFLLLTVKHSELFPVSIDLLSEDPLTFSVWSQFRKEIHGHFIVIELNNSEVIIMVFCVALCLLCYIFVLHMCTQHYPLSKSCHRVVYFLY